MKYNRHSKLIDWNKEQKDINEKYTGVRHTDTLLRGSIFNCNLGENIVTEMNGKRPVLIVSNDTGNRYSDDVIVIPLTKSNNKHRNGSIKLLPTHYLLKKNKYKLTFDSVVRAESMRAISKHRLDSKSIDKIDSEDMQEVDKRLRTALEL